MMFTVEDAQDEIVFQEEYSTSEKHLVTFGDEFTASLLDVKILSEGGYLKQFTITFVEEVKQYTTISNTLNAYVTYREVF